MNEPVKKTLSESPELEWVFTFTLHDTTVKLSGVEKRTKPPGKRKWTTTEWRAWLSREHGNILRDAPDYSALAAEAVDEFRARLAFEPPRPSR